MRKLYYSDAFIVVALLFGMSACSSGDDGDDAAADTDAGTGMMDDDASTSGDSSPVTTSPTTGVTSLPPPDSGDDGDSTAGDDGEPGGFDFDDTPPERMTQVDRMGMPAINTAVIMSKDDYNSSSPSDDIEGAFVDEIVASLEGLHAALDDDLMALDLTPCAVETCVAQAAPIVVPDVLHIDPTQPAGFPNGRLLSDPVVDVTLAVILLDLSVGGQSALTLAQVPVNPPENDKAFLTEFPYLAEPH